MVSRKKKSKLARIELGKKCLTSDELSEDELSEELDDEDDDDDVEFFLDRFFLLFLDFLSFFLRFLLSTSFFISSSAFS